MARLSSLRSISEAIVGRTISGVRALTNTAPSVRAGCGVVGAIVGRSDGEGKFEDVQRCAAVPAQTRPEFWDVTYNFRDQEYRMQATTPPGPTVTVNDRGKPRA